MAYSQLELTDFVSFFRGNTEAYGQTDVGDIVNGKAEAKSRLVHEIPSAAVYNRHLAGQTSIGIAPIMSNNECYFGAIDIDDYAYSLVDIIEAIEDFSLPLVPCWSKSKKLHIYILFSEATPAAEVQELCSWYAAAFACKPKTEIFPKQSKTTSTNTFYSWINLPYFDADNEDNWRKMVGKNGRLYSLPEAIDLMRARRLSLAEHKAFIQTIPYFDAPPCILSGVLLRDIGPGQRNNWLFSAGVYLRMKDETVDLDSELSALNDSLHEPISRVELENTILKGFSRKTYFYMCSAMQRCNEKLCRKKPFGKDSSASTGLEYGDLTQVLTDPPYYEWIVNGQKLTFYNENEILMQTKFRALCMRQLHIVPRRAKDDTWSGILTRALEHVKVIEPTITTGDFSTGSVLLDSIYDYFTARRKAENITQISMGRVYEDKVEKEYVFTARSFMDYIQNTRNLKVSGIEMRSRLVEMGAYKDRNMWRIPKESIPEAQNTGINVSFRTQGTGDETEF